MSQDVRPELLVSLVYDMALVSGIQEKLRSIVYDFNLDRGSVLSHRLFSLAVYYCLCRCVHPSGLTLGEEFTELVPSQSPRRRWDRVRWTGASLAMHAVRLYLLPRMRQQGGLVASLVEFLTVVCGDAWFCLSPQPGALSLMEERLQPHRPVGVRAGPKLQFPPYLFPLLGSVILVKATLAFLHSVRASKSIGKLAEVNHADESSEASYSGNCSVCMSSMQVPTATVCGHVFCWECILEWTRGEKPACPSCRTECLPQDLLPLVHYAPVSSDWKPFWQRPLLISE